MLIQYLCTLSCFMFTNVPRYHLVEVKVFCMCYSFVTRNEGTQPRTCKEMYDSFQARIDADKSSQYDEEHKDSLEDFLSSLGESTGNLSITRRKASNDLRRSEGVSICSDNMTCSCGVG